MRKLKRKLLELNQEKKEIFLRINGPIITNPLYHRLDNERYKELIQKISEIEKQCKKHWLKRLFGFVFRNTQFDISM